MHVQRDWRLEPIQGRALRRVLAQQRAGPTKVVVFVFVFAAVVAAFIIGAMPR